MSDDDELRPSRHAGRRPWPFPLAFNPLQAVASFGAVRDDHGGPRRQGHADLSGRMIVVQVAASRFPSVDTSANLLFAPRLGVQEGHCMDGRWMRDRLLNGNETAFRPMLPAAGASPIVTTQVVR